MSYREYTDSRGRLHRRSYNGHRFTEPAIVKDDPDGSYWKVRALTATNKLEAMYSPDEYDAWKIRTFGAFTAEAFTWQQIATAAELELDNPTECTCSHVNDLACPLCASIAELQDIPY